MDLVLFLLALFPLAFSNQVACNEMEDNRGPS
jgi:hypothetical protein